MPKKITNLKLLKAIDIFYSFYKPIMVFAIVFFGFSTQLAYAQQPAANLDQVRNGAANSINDPGEWVNGNLGEQTSHYAESMSVPYRAVLTNMPATTEVTLTLEYDVKHSDRHAIDYLTSYDRIQPHMLAYGHAQEEIDPTIGTSFSENVGRQDFDIPSPPGNNSPVVGMPASSWAVVDAADSARMSIWNGTITSITYGPTADLSQSNEPQQIIVTFTSGSAGTVLLAWGGHIGSRNDWGFDGDGIARSAGGISGSPYHMRLIDWNLNNLGNQDRSLSAASVIPEPDCSLSGPESVCQDTNAVYTLTPIDAVDPSYTWEIINNTSNASFVVDPTDTTSATVTSTTSGSYTVKATISSEYGMNTCETMTTVNPNPNCNAGGPYHIDCDTPNGTITLDGSSTTQGATFQWSITNGANIPTDANGDASVSEAGNYTLTVTANGCVSTCTVDVTKDVTPPNCNAGGPYHIDCDTPNGTITLDGSSTTQGATFQWSITNGANIPTDANGDASVSDAGNYTLTVTDPSNGCVSTCTVDVTKDVTPPNCNAGGPYHIDCDTPNGTITLDGSSTTQGATFQWSITNGANIPTDANGDASVSDAGNYTLTVTDPSNGCVSTCTVDVTKDVTPPNCNAGGPYHIDCDTPNGTITLDGSSTTQGATFQWSITNGANIPTDANGDASVSDAGNYTLTVTDPSNGCVSTCTVDVTKDVTPPNCNAGGPYHIDCDTPNGTITLDGSSTTQGATFQWSITNGANIPTDANGDASVSDAGNYTLTVTDPSNGCVSTCTVDVTKDVTPPNCNAGGPYHIDCDTPNGTITLDGSSTTQGATFQWSITNGANIPTDANGDASVSDAGNYTLTVTDPSNGCVSTCTVDVTKDVTPPNCNAGGPYHIDCDTPNGTITLDGSSTTQGATFQWSITNGANIPTDANGDASVSDAGNYTLTVTDPSNGCVSTCTVDVTKDVTPPNCNAGGPYHIDCDTPNGTITLDGSSTTQGATFQWSITNGANIPTDANGDASVSDAGNYTLTVTDPSNGCVSTCTVDVTKDVTPPNCNAGGPYHIDCDTPNGTITLDGSSTTQGATFQWSITNGANIPTDANGDASVSDAGNYTLTVTDPSNGCVSTCTVDVTKDVTPPNCNAGGPYHIDCDTPNGTITLDGSSTTQGATFQWSITNGANIPTDANGDASVSDAGNYTLTVTNPANGCVSTCSVDVTKDVTPPDCEITGDTFICPGEKSIFTAKAGANYSYVWKFDGNIISTSASTGDITLPGEYTVYVTDNSNGCESSCSKTLEVGGTPFKPSVTPFDYCENDLPASYAAFSPTLPNGVTGTIVWYENGSPILPEGTLPDVKDVPGTYTFVLQIRTTDNCITSSGQALQFEVFAKPIVDAGLSPDPLCSQGGSVQLTGSPAGGTWSGDYVSASGLFTVPAGGLTAGSYTVTYTYTTPEIDGACTDSDTVDIPVVDCTECGTAFGVALNADKTAIDESISTCFREDGFHRWGWTNSIDPGETLTLDLYRGAGQCLLNKGEYVGYVTVTYTGSPDYNITAVFTPKDSNTGFDEIHLYVGCEPYPRLKNGNLTVAPGQYTFVAEGNGFAEGWSTSTDAEKQIHVPNGGQVYVIAHVVACTDKSDEVAPNGFVPREGYGEFSDTPPNGDYGDCVVNVDPWLRLAGDSKVSAYPVPFKDQVNLRYKFDYDTNVTINVYDIKGALIKQVEDVNYTKGTYSTKSIDLSAADDQMYFVRVTTSKESAVKKIISSKSQD